MTEYTTYSMNDDIQAYFPFPFTATSRPTTSQIGLFRYHIFGLIKGKLGGLRADTNGDLKFLEISKVLEEIDNYYARGRGERTIPVEITDKDVKDFITPNADDSYGGGHYSVEVP